MAKLKDIPKFDRPREKFLEKGPDALTDSELLAILLGSGIKGTNVKVLSQKIIKKFGDNLLNASVDDLMQISGIGQAKALQISSALALTRRIFDKQSSLDNLILSAQDAVALVSDLKDKKQEHLICLYLNARNALIKKEIISIGTLDKSIIHPREIFAPGLEMHAAGVILIHNHPSGDSSPSEQDKQVSKRIIEAGQLMGINVIDFLIIAKNGVHSILGEIKNTELTNTDYVAEGSQTSLFDLLVDTNQSYFYEKDLSQNIPKNKNNALSFIDLFAGVGGIRFGFEQSGGKCVFGSEIDNECQKTYYLNFGEYPRGDIKAINEKNIPDHDILTAGFPCQPFSICGRQKGFEDVRGTLFFDILRIVKEKQPKVVFLENVKQLKYHDKGNTLKVILSSLQELGYKTKWKILNAKDFGTAQNRERIIIIGNKEKEFDFSKLKHSPKVILKDILQKEGNFEFMDEKDYTLIKNPKTQKSGLIFAGYRNKKIRTNGVRDNTLHLSRVHKQPNRIYSSDGTHPTLPSQESSGRYFILHEGRVRKLTIDECFALQGFPKKFKKFSSNGRLYQQIGNSVCVPMMAELSREIINQYF